MCYRLYPPPCAPYELLPCPAAANWARRLCSIIEDTRGKVTAGVANAGAGTGAGAGAGAGAAACAGAGVMLEFCAPFLRCPYLETSTEHRTEHFLMGGSKCCITFHIHEFLFIFPVGGGIIIVTVASFSSVRVLLNEEYRTPKWSLCHAPPYPRKVQGNHCFDSCLWLSPQTPQLKTTFLTCEAELCSGSPPE